jgi:hypothetical protein
MEDGEDCKDGEDCILTGIYARLADIYCFTCYTCERMFTHLHVSSDNLKSDDCGKLSILFKCGRPECHGKRNNIGWTYCPRHENKLILEMMARESTAVYRLWMVRQVVAILGPDVASYMGRFIIVDCCIQVVVQN